MRKTLGILLLTALFLGLMSIGVAWAETELPILPITSNYLADPQVPTEVQTPGKLEDTGIYFELTNSEYINVTLDSSEPIKIVLESVPEMITLHIEPASNSSSAQITLGGFTPLTTYHMYADNYHNHLAFTTDASGNYTYTQDLSKAHLIFIQPRPSTIFLSDNGWSKPGIGTWDADAKVATLTQDVTETIQIDNDGITLDGNGHAVIGSGTGNGVYLPDRTGVKIENLTVNNFMYGIHLYRSNFNSVTGSNASLNKYCGIWLNYSSNNTVTNSTANLNTYHGILLNRSDANTCNDNTANANGNVGIKLEENDGSNSFAGNSANSNRYCGFWVTNGSSNNSFTGNTVNGNEIYGLYFYWSNNNTLTRNNISSNAWSMSTNNIYGLYMGYCSNNKVYNNNFINNRGQARFDGSWLYNTLDLAKPTGGNYWSNWTSPDNNRDGFVDYPYGVNAAQDNLPWTTPNGWVTALDKTAPLTQVSLSGDLGSDGWYTSAVQVSLSASDGVDGSGVVKTEYSFNDTDWTTYTVPFTVSAEGTTTAYYRSTDKAGNVEPAKQQVVKIAVPVPVTSLSLSGMLGQNDWYQSDVQVQLTAVDEVSGVAKTEYSSDGAAWDIYNEPFTISEEGTATVYYRSINNAGRTEEAKQASVNIDKTPPSTSAAILNGDLGDNDWYVSDIQVQLTAMDDISGVAKTEYSFDGEHWMVYSAPFIVSTEGAMTLYYRSTDRAGNVEETREKALKQDTIAPITTVILEGIMGQNDWYVSDVTVTMTAIDNEGGSGVARTEYSFDGENWITYTGPFAIDVEGITTLYYRSIDNAGNIEAIDDGEGGHCIPVNRDPEVPTTTIIPSLPGGDNGWYTSPAQITLVSGDNGSGVARTEYNFGGTDWTPYMGPFTVSDEGTTTVYYRSIDNAGNVGPVQEYVVRIDTIPPTVTTNIGDGWYSSPELSLSVGDGGSGVDRIGYSIGDGPWYPYTGPIAIPGDGPTDVYYCSKDKAGNRTYKKIVIKIDKTAPVTRLILEGTIGENDWYVSDVKATLIATDNVSGVAKTEYSFDGEDWVTYTSQFLITAEGETTIYYRSTDMAGNVEITKQQTLKIDKTPPLITISIPSDGAEYSLGQLVLANWTATDTVSGLASAAGTVASGEAIDTSIVGAHTFTVDATDNAGNHTIKTVTYYVRYANFRILPPIYASGDRTVFKYGSTVPVKFQLQDANGNLVTNAVARIYLSKVVDGVPGSEVEGVSTSPATTGNSFGSNGNHYSFDLATKNLSVGIWRIRIELNDGSSKFVTVTLR